MRPVRIDPVMEAGFGGAARDAAMPAPLGKHVMTGATETARSRRSPLGIAVRLIRDAAIAVAFMALVPIGIVAFRGRTLTRAAIFSDYAHRAMLKTDLWRPLMVARDPSITPVQAGIAYGAIQQVKEQNGFTPLPVANQLEAAWRDARPRFDMFVDAPPDPNHIPASKQILPAAMKGFSPAELAYLNRLANAPAWRAFDLVARAPTVDILGGQFRIPFGEGANPDFRPNQFYAVREMASAAVSRAAYHMAIGQRDSAEMVLRSIVSFGFALVDNGTSALEELMGGQIVDAGRIALRQFYQLQHDPRAASTTLGDRPNVKFTGEEVPLAVFRAEHLARLNDPTVHRGERFESLSLIAKSSCTNVSELVLGPRSDVTTAIDKARRDLARYPSERALVDLMTGTATPSPPQGSSNPISELAVSAASAAGAAFHNHRFAQCARILTQW